MPNAGKTKKMTKKNALDNTDADITRFAYSRVYDIPYCICRATLDHCHTCWLLTIVLQSMPQLQSVQLRHGVAVVHAQSSFVPKHLPALECYCSVLSLSSSSLLSLFFLVLSWRQLLLLLYSLAGDLNPDDPAQLCSLYYYCLDLFRCCYRYFWSTTITKYEKTMTQKKTLAIQAAIRVARVLLVSASG